MDTDDDSSSSSKSSSEIAEEITESPDEPEIEDKNFGSRKDDVGAPRTDNMPGDTEVDENSNIDLNGPLGYSDVQDYNDSFGENITFEQNNTKFYAPVFIHVTSEPISEPGKRHSTRLEPDIAPGWTYQGISCISVTEMKLRELPRESAMLDTGYIEFDEVKSEYESRFGEEVTGDTTIYVHTFAKTIPIGRLAASNYAFSKDGEVDQTKLYRGVFSEVFLPNTASDIPEWESDFE